MSTPRTVKRGPWTVLNSREVYRNAWITVREDQVLRPNGSPGIYGVVQCEAAVGIVALTGDGRVYLVGQYRYTTGEYSWEIPTGTATPGESLLESAKRELREETGLSAASWTSLGSVQVSNSFTDQIGHLYLARDLSSGDAEPDETEELATRTVPFEDAVTQAANGEISQAFAALGLLRAWRYLQTLSTPVSPAFLPVFLLALTLLTTALAACSPVPAGNATSPPSARSQGAPEVSGTSVSGSVAGIAPGVSFAVLATATVAAPPTPTLVPTAVPTPVPTATPINLPVPQSAGEDPADQRTIAGLRARAYEGGPIEIVRTLATTATYTSYLITYPSDGLRVTGYLNVPRGPHGAGPFPVIVVNHGYVNPSGYAAVASNYTKREGDYFASRGYLTAGSDFRGHGNNPGTAVGSHLESAYVIDALNLVASLKTYPQADTTRLGVWGHSNGGSISERMMVVSKDVRATVMWAGVSAEATDAWLYLRDWLRRPEAQVRTQYGHPDEQSELYRRMSSREYLADVAGPVQIHHGTADASVPYAHATQLDRRLTEAGKPHELFTYPGAPHNWFGAIWDTAIGRSLAFYDVNLRG